MPFGEGEKKGCGRNLFAAACYTATTNFAAFLEDIKVNVSIILSFVA